MSLRAQPVKAEVSREKRSNASKAAIHMLTELIRLQLADTPLNAYIDEVVILLETQPDAKRILVENGKFLRFGEARGDYDRRRRGTERDRSGRALIRLRREKP